MRKFLYRKEILLVFMLLFVSFRAQAQRMSPNPYAIYIDSVKMDKYNQRAILKQDKAFFLVSLKGGLKEYDLYKRGIYPVRRLNNSHYIIRFGSISDQEKSVLFQNIFPANDRWKLSNFLQNSSKSFAHEEQRLFSVSVDDVDSFRQALKGIKSVTVVEFLQTKTFVLRCSYRFIETAVLPLSTVVFVDRMITSVQEESVLLDADLSVNQVNVLHHLFPDLNGVGMTVSVKEQQFDPQDMDFLGRLLSSDIEASSVSRHATEMATVIAGAGNSSVKSKGVAWRSKLISSDYNQLFPDPVSYYKTNDIYVQNHSYGTVIENQYGALAHAYDGHAGENPYLLHVFSVGNSGTAKDETGPYKDVEGFANLTGNFKMAKNILTVGAVDTVLRVDPFVSKGPAYDGRVKPELVAYSSLGSSSSAAMVTGVVALLQQAYKEKYAGALPPAVLLKGILINTAEDVGPEGIDFLSGYGNVDAKDALEVLKSESYFTGTVQHGELHVFDLNIPANVKNLKVTLVWNDPAAQPNAATALVNDLDLELEQVSTGQDWFPWVLNSYPHLDSLKQLPKRKADHLNNVEQITLQSPAEGMYKIRVSGFDIPLGPQSFYLIYQWEMANQFEWTYPTGGDNMPSYERESSIFRWESTYGAETGKLEYSMDGGSTWRLIQNEVDLSKEFYQWNAPDTFTTAIARMTVDGSSYLTDEFTISRPLTTSVGFNCTDSVMISWNKVSGVEGYEVYTLGDNYLTTVATTTDTAFIFKKAEYPGEFFAVAPLVKDQFVGVRNQTFNYSLQGVDCFLANFTASISQMNGVELSLNIGTTYQVKEVWLERKTNADFVLIHSFEEVASKSLSYIDMEPNQGYNEYRARLMLANGQELVTDTYSIYFLTEEPFLVFPNPVERGGVLHVYTKLTAKEVFLKVFNPQGQVMMEKVIYSDREQLSVAELTAGIYFYTLIIDGVKRSGKIIVL